MRTFRNIETLVLGLALTVGSFGCGGEMLVVESADGVTKVENEVVYGTDNRQDVYAHPSATLRQRAQQSTVALISKNSLNTSNPNNVTFYSSTLGASHNLCSTERFRNDPTAAFCSGTLIDDDLVLTAGHCISTASECSNTRFVFNYYRTSSTTMQTVTTADVFSCSEIVARQEGTIGGQNLDYAIIRLDRPATPRFVPAPVREGNSAVSVGQNVAVIGSGSGIPFKIDSGGKVRNSRSSVLDYFVATTDTFGGNSGSGVYETGTHKVVGILVRGETDYVSNGSCNVVNVCSETGCDGESVTYVYPAIQDYCASHTSARLCGDGEPTTPTPPSQGETAVENFTGSVAQGGEQNYGPFHVVPGTTFDVVMSGSGDPDLYVKFGSQPTTSSYDCRPYKSGASETCSVTVPSNVTTAYVMVRGYSSATFSLQVSYTIPSSSSGGSTPTVQTTNYGGSVAKSENRFHGPLTVVPGTPFEVVMTGSGDPDLYVRFGSSPTTSAYDCRPYKSGANESCALNVPAGETQAYIMVRGYSAATYSLDVTWTAP